jgi:RalA-binding protein 1
MKTEVQNYLQGLCSEENLSERSDVCTFLTNNIVSNRAAPVSNPGYKAGYLTKKGRSFGGWTTRYYVLQGRLLEYYDTVGDTLKSMCRTAD